MADKHPYVINPELTGLSLAYKNQSYIADLVLPRKTVTAELFKYTKYDKASFFTVPQTLTSRKGEAREVELKGTDTTESVELHSLKDVVPQADIDAATGTNQDPLAKSTNYLTELLLLAREIRIAKYMQTKSNFGNVTDLTDKSNFSVETINPIDMICDIIEGMIVTPNTMVINKKGLSRLCRNPYVVKAFGNVSGIGKVPLDFIKETFGIQNLLVGEAQVNSVKKGQSPVLTGAWGNNIALYYNNPVAEIDMGMTFGLTAEFGTRTIKTYFDEDRGAKGAEIVRGVEQNKAISIAPECGALITNIFNF